MKVCIIGGGPTGSFMAYKLARHFDVEVFEDHPEIGRPVQCSGLVTKAIRKIDNIFNSEEFEGLINNRISEVRLFSDKEKYELTLKDPDIVLKRDQFDKWLGKLAEQEGAKFNFNSKFTKFDKENGSLSLHIKKKGEIQKIKADILIGADGYFSRVSECLGNKRNFVPCVQANINYKSNPDVMDIYFSSKYKELFAWVVPKDKNVSEIGLGCKEKPVEKFREFLKERNIKGKITGYTGGPISLYSPKFKNSEGNVYLAGEAAGFVKGSTLGGIIPSLNSVKSLANSLINGKDYGKETKKLRKEMMLHYITRKFLDKFSDQDYDYMLKLCNTEKVKALLSEHSRDEYSTNSFRIKMLMAQPRFTKFLLKAIM